DVIRFLIDGALYERSPKKWTMKDRIRETERERLRQVGIIHATTSKEMLVNGGSIVFSSFESLERQLSNLTHWTPQIYMFGKENNEGRVLENIRFITTVGVDVDYKVSVEEIMYTAVMEGLPIPNLILDTPRGVQFFYRFDKPFAGSLKARRAAKLIGEELKRVFVKGINADPSCNTLGYFRIPSENNILFFSKNAVNSEWILAWAKRKARENKRTRIERETAIYKKQGIMDDPAIRSIIDNVLIKGQRGQIGRNNAIFTLSLALKYEGKTEQEILDQMDEWNSKLRYPLTHNEVKRIVKSAMKEKYKAPSKEFVEELAGVEMKFRFDIRTPKRERHERIQSHYNEWEQDIIYYLEQNCTPDQPYLAGSLRTLAKMLGESSPVAKAMGKSSLIDVLKRSKRLIVKNNGKKGRNAVTFITCRTVLIKSHKHTFKAFLLDKAPYTHELEQGLACHVPNTSHKCIEPTCSISEIDDSGG
ncbi:MAG TPA: primase C-terminal domain-containing protein, partial [Metabacillus sp.]|nr:primase C-terminal domain-containing protein [Metabacillus sp.]